jgi:hypothetical protein
VDAKEPEHQKNESQPNASATGDNQDRHAGFHAVTCPLLAGSRQPLEQRHQERENAQGSKRPEPHQSKSPERL